MPKGIPNKRTGNLFIDETVQQHSGRMVKFIQIISVSYTYSDDSGREGSSVVALGDDGCVYQYMRGEVKAWVPFNIEIIRRI